MSKSGTQSSKRDMVFSGDTVREMEAADWASLSDEELLERRQE